MSLQITTHLTFNNQHKENKTQHIEVAEIVKQSLEKPSETTPESGKQFVQTQMPQQTLLHTLQMKKNR